VEPLLVALITLNVSCLAAFQWGRRRYFHQAGNDRIRGWLGPLGTIFAAAQLPLVWVGGHYSDSFLIIIAELLYALSLCLFFWTVNSHQERPGIAFTPGAPAVLVTTGAYRVARHPFYLAYLLFWGGVAVVAPFASGLPIFVVMSILYARTAVYEEAGIMRSPLASDYTEYRSRVGMFFIWPR